MALRIHPGEKMTLIALALVMASLAHPEGAVERKPGWPGSAPAMPEFPECRFDRTARLVERLADLPAPVRSEMGRLFESAGGIADAGDYFEASDSAISNAPTARFLRAYFVQDSWLIWFERGGVGLGRHMMAMAERRDDKTGGLVMRTVPGSHFATDLCAGSKAYLMGARSAG
jgi:hypothetical protein